MRISFQERFERHFIPEPNSGCWLWTAFIAENGYGHFCDADGENRGAHCVSWEIYRGQIPDGLHVLHTRDVRCCVNPSHLFVGTPFDNMQDAARKGRTCSGDEFWSRKSPEKVCRGEKNTQHKLSEVQVSEIIVSPLGCRKLADRYGVSRQQIRRIVLNKAWPHVGRPPS